MLLPLHGAAAAEHIGDPKGDLTGAVRALLGSGALVVTDRDPQRAAQLATGLAEDYWRRRAELEPEVRTPEQAVAAGLQVDGTVLLVETADCAAAAAPPPTARPRSRRCSAPSCPAPPWYRWWTRPRRAPATTPVPGTPSPWPWRISLDRRFDDCAEPVLRFL